MIHRNYRTLKAGMLKRVLCLAIFAGVSCNLSGAITSTHPRVLLDAAAIAKLQTRYAANTPEWQRVYQRCQAYWSWTGEHIISDYIEQYNYIQTYALGYYATNNTAYMDRAVSTLMAFCRATDPVTSIAFDSDYRSRTYLVAMALGYDWCYNHMSSLQRDTIRQRLVQWADHVYANGYARYGSLYYEPGNNYAAGHLVGIMLTGLAIHSEDAANGNKYISYCDNTITDMMGFLNTRLTGGDANEGWSYGSGYAMNVFMAFAGRLTADPAVTSLFNNTPWDQQVIQFLTYAMLPDRKHLLPNGDWARESTGLIWDQHRTVADIISSYCDIQQSRKIASFWGRDVWPASSMHNFYVWRPFLFYNNEETPVNYETVAPYSDTLYLFTDSAGTGQFLQRTGWKSNDMWVSFRAGGMYGDHAHNGNGHFEIWENGWLVIDDNILSSSGIQIPDWSHNCVQFQTVSDDWDLPANDYNMAEHAAIPRREFTDYYSYIWENSDGVYSLQSNNTSSKAERRFLYMPKQKLVFTYDIAATFTAAQSKKYRLNFPAAPVNNGGTLTYSNGTSRVRAHTVYPSNANIAITDNVADISYPSGQQKNYFVEALYTQPSGNAAYAVQEISRDNSNVTISDFYGANVVMGDTSYVALFAGDNTTSYSFDHLAYNINTNTKVYHLIEGLVPNTTYYITADTAGPTMGIDINVVNTGGVTFSQQSTPAGILFFSLHSGGTPTSIASLVPSHGLQLFPNPSSGHVDISYVIENQAEVKLEIYNLLGEKIETIVQSLQNKGAYHYAFDIGAGHSDAGAGMYFVKLSVNGMQTTQRLVRLR